MTMRLRLLAPVVAVVAAASLAGCDDAATHAAIPGSDPARGLAAIQRHGCSACHLVPGVRAPGGRIGPPLTALARNVYVAGILPNQPDHLIRWILDPPAVDPRTAMPDLGVSTAEARDIASYLYAVSR